MIQRIVGLILIILVTLTGLCWGQARSDRLYNGVLRLHVIANSDETSDQEVKLKVRDAIVEYLSSEFKDVTSVEQARQRAVEKTHYLEEIAEQILNNHGFTYPAEVEVSFCEFPTKAYGDLVLPQGKYQAVRVVLGEGKGQNWWCVLFPPLCLATTSDQGLALDNTDYRLDNMEIKWKVMELKEAD